MGAINIFAGKSQGKTNSGGSKSAGRQSNTSKLISKATPGGLVASTSGKTAVSKSGVMGKVLNFAQDVLPVISEYAPGPVGTVAKIASSIFNNPEWWQSHPGEGVTTNLPLQPISNERTFPGPSVHGEVWNLRPAMLQFESVSARVNTSASPYYAVNAPVGIYLTENEATQYLMPQVRQVVNAVPLQSADAYRQAFSIGTEAMAFYQTLKKFRYLLGHGLTYMPNLNDVAFPVFQNTNFALLEATINRLEEFLRSTIRLPHTTCEYLAWRFGRVYKSNTSAKSPLVMYNMFSIGSSAADLSAEVGYLTSAVSASVAVQQAVTDIFNAFSDHDQAVELEEASQIHYDFKEFVLRTNLDVVGNSLSVASAAVNSDPDVVIMDSDLDNPTTFMASTLSTLGLDASGSLSVLLPVNAAHCFLTHPGTSLSGLTGVITPFGGTSIWSYEGLSPFADSTHILFPGTAVTIDTIVPVVRAMLAKSLDYYNADILLEIGDDVSGLAEVYDLTALAIDTGFVSNSVIGNEHIYAVANLCDLSHKTGVSYKAVVTSVARDVADLAEKTAAVTPT